MYDIFVISKNVVDPNVYRIVKDKYPTAQKLDRVFSIDQVAKKSFTKMFWIIWDDLILQPNFDLNLYRTDEWDDMYIHVFKNKDFYDGLALIPKTATISVKEFKYRFYLKKKEIDVVATIPKAFPIYKIHSYQEYENILNQSNEEMFWCVWPEIDIIEKKIFDSYFSWHNEFDRSINHVYKHLFRNEETYTNGIVLFSKNKKITKKEFDHRFIIQKKEHPIVSSKLKPYDMVFISYDESNADDNYNKILKRFPKCKRIHGVKGIHNAHIAAAKISDSEMFWVIDADAEIVDSFNFDYEVSTYEKDIVHVWRSKNSVNDLVYGYGGVKLLPKNLTLNLNVETVDMTTSISKRFRAIDEISNITKFNTDPFNTWKSAFRECVKLSSKIIDRQKNDETDYRLNVWMSEGAERPFGEYCINGAKDGFEFGQQNKDTPLLGKINDFVWLKEFFDSKYG